MQKSHEQVVDIVSKDEVTFSGYSQDAKDKAAALTKEFERYLAEHPDHRRGFAKTNTWWWQGLQTEPRFKTLIASAE